LSPPVHSDRELQTLKSPISRKRPPPANVSRIRRWLFIILGTLALGLGIVGIFVPLLPTTPLLLAAAACYLRSSERMHAWLLNHRWFGPFIRHYRQHRAITKRHKILTLILLWAAIGYSSIWATHNLFLRICLWAIAAGVTIHVLSLRTWKEGISAPENGEHSTR